jgi:hypothetical protein
MKTHVRMELSEECQQVGCVTGIVIKGAVEHSHIAYAVLTYVGESASDLVYADVPHRFLSTADAEGAGIEASTGCFQLHERFSPIEETTLFWSAERGKVGNLRFAIIVVSTVVRYEA